MPFPAELVRDGVDAADVPPHDFGDDEYEDIEPVIVTLPAALAKATAVAAEDISGKRMAALGAVEMGRDSSPAAIVVEEDGRVVGGLLTRVFSAEVVEQVLADAGRTAQRNRSLPARLMA